MSAPARLVYHRRYLLVRDAAGTIVRRIDITDCVWCGNTDHVCSSCSSKAEEARAAITTKDGQPC